MEWSVCGGRASSNSSYIRKRKTTVFIYFSWQRFVGLHSTFWHCTNILIWVSQNMWERRRIKAPLVEFNGIKLIESNIRWGLNGFQRNWLSLNRSEIRNDSSSCCAALGIANLFELERNLWYKWFGILRQTGNAKINSPGIAIIPSF